MQTELSFHLPFRSPRLLPSFPTRRSSDLTRAAARRPAARARRRSGVRAPQSADPQTAGAGGGARGPAGGDHRTRSEEHTSELQSHSDLVCRLLLEKKTENRSPGIGVLKTQ